MVSRTKLVTGTSAVGISDRRRGSSSLAFSVRGSVWNRS
ncbi:Uncharacterised protein [Vibrio cholerae]|nr:Uncharacterised protein [Vibrio cholerae]